MSHFSRVFLPVGHMAFFKKNESLFSGILYGIKKKKKKDYIVTREFSGKIDFFFFTGIFTREAYGILFF
jgi:hypothetical protein